MNNATSNDDDRVIKRKTEEKGKKKSRFIMHDARNKGAACKGINKGYGRMISKGGGME